MKVWYNEIDPFAAAWLRELMAEGAIPQGVVDERSIADVEPRDLAGYDQCHFFAGIGGWAHALELADWRGPVWTGSCPCQPLSSAGQRKGHADERHLWPAFHRLIAECRPATVFGEQVASKDGREWLAGIRADLEECGYAVGAADLCAAGVGAPHIRQRLYWVADAANGRHQSVAGDRRVRESEVRDITVFEFGDTCSGALWVADAHEAGRGEFGRKPAEDRDASSGHNADGSRAHGGLAHPDGRVSRDGDLQRGGQHGQRAEDGGVGDGVGNAAGGGCGQRRSHSRRGAEGVYPNGGAGPLHDGAAERLGDSGLTGLSTSERDDVRGAGRGGAGRGGGRKGEQLANQVAHSGAIASSSPAPTEKRGASLNPHFSAWLMGFPPIWMRCLPKRRSRSRAALKIELAPSAPSETPSCPA